MESIEVTYTLGDWFAATLQSWRNYLFRVVLFVGVLAAVLITLPVVLDGASLQDVANWIPWELFLWAGLALLAFYMGVCPLISYFAAKRKGGLGPQRFALSDAGVRVEGPKGESLIYWSTLKRVTTSRDRLFLFIGPALAFVLPTRIFTDRVAFEAVVEEAKARWAAAKP